MCEAGRKPRLGEALTTARRFVLVRHRDVTGVAGTGIVADGCEFPSGRAVVAWRGSWPSIAVHESIRSVEAIHGHKGATEIRFIDEWPERAG